MEERLRVLIVGDDEQARAEARAALRASGLNVAAEEAADRASAITALKRQSFDSVFLDLQPPEDESLALLRAMRAAGIRTPVVALAGPGDERTAVELRDAGASDYLPKSLLTPASLAQSLRSALRVHQAEEALRASERQFDTTLRCIGDAVIATDTMRRVTFMNAVAETLTGWTLEEARGKDLHDVFVIVNESTRRKTRSPVDVALREGRPVARSNHTLLFARDGRQTPIDESASPMRDGGGPLTGVVLAFRDITERRRAHQELQESEMRAEARIQMLNERLRITFKQMQDRVRNNLQRIASLIDGQYVEKARAITPLELRQLSRHIHMLAAVNDILMRLEPEELLMQRVSARTVLERLLPLLQETTYSRHIHADIDEVNIRVRQANALAMIVNELVSNALKFSRSELYVTLCEDGGMGRLQVRDDGPGFPGGFEPYQEDHLGLELAGMLIRIDLGGKADFVNRPEGGAQVTVLFPLPE
jgi:PAS domain S-box-containing protein